MNATSQKLIALASLCLILVGCAQTGPPLPPSLELAKPPTDLHASRKGNTVTLSWSEPAQTTDRQTVRYLGPTLICRNAGSEMATCGNQVAIIPPPANAAEKPKKSQGPMPAVIETYADTLPQSAQSDNPDAELTYAVEVLNRNARGAGLSNRVHVPAITTLPAPNDLSAALSEDGVDLTWTSAPRRRRNRESSIAIVSIAGARRLVVTMGPPTSLAIKTISEIRRTRTKTRSPLKCP